MLDVGSLAGSFPADYCPGALVVRVDLERPAASSRDGFVQADAARLPFRERSFDVVVANHSLEHIQGLASAIEEMGRVVRLDGSLYVAVPDASTFSDRLYRWIYGDSSGHINPFCSAPALAADITRATGLPLTAVREIYSSFEYLNRYYFGDKPSWRVRLLGNGSRWFILLLSYITRTIDRIFDTRVSAYGWAFYFGSVGEDVKPERWSNVCSGCGAGHSAAWLSVKKLVRRHLLVFRSYQCPNCGARNFFTPDPANARILPIKHFPETEPRP